VCSHEQRTARAKCCISFLACLIKDDKPQNIIKDDKPQNIIKDDKPQNIIKDDKPQNIIKDHKPQNIIKDDKPQNIIKDDNTTEHKQTVQAHGAESLKILQFISWSKIFPTHIMEPEVLLPHSQNPFTCPYPEKKCQLNPIISLRCFLIYSSRLRPVLPIALFMYTFLFYRPTRSDRFTLLI